MGAHRQRRRGTGGGAGVAAAGQRDRGTAGKRCCAILEVDVPVGAEPVTVAVKVTFVPTIDGVSDVATVVDVAPRRD